MEVNRRREWPLVLALMVLIVIAGSAHNLLQLAKYGLTLSSDTYLTLVPDEYYKMVEVQSAMKGFLLVGDPFLREEQYAPASNTPYGPALAGLALKATGISVGTSSWLLDVLVPPLMLLLVFWLFGRLFPETSRRTSWILAFLFTLVFLMAPSQRGLMRYMACQATQPVFILLFLGGAIHFGSGVTRREYAGLLILNCAMPWLDPWFGLVLGGTHILAMIACLIQGRRERAADFGLIFLASVAGGLPEALRLMDLGPRPGFALLMDRQGRLVTHLPNYPDYLVWMAILGVVALVAWKAGLMPSPNQHAAYAGLMLAVCTGVYFQNLVTGRRFYFQGEHIAGKALVGAGLLVSVIAARAAMRMESRRRAFVLGVMVLMAIVHHGSMIREVTRWATPAAAFDPVYGYDGLQAQRVYGPSFAWLRENAPDTAVVLADPVNDMILRLAADKYSYSSQYAIYISTDQEQFIERYWPFLWARGRSRIPTAPDPVWSMDRHLENYNPRDCGIIYGSIVAALPHRLRVNAFLARLGLPPLYDAEQARANLQARIDSIYSGYEDYVEKHPIGGIADLLRYSCDYVLWGPQERHFQPAYQPDTDTTLRRVFRDEANGVDVFAVL